MLALMFLGYAAFMAASFALGTRLLRLARRTHEWPELTIGISFLLGGGIGYLAWFVLGILGAMAGSGGTAVPQSDELFAVGKVVTLVGLVASALGSLSNGIGIAQIYRAGRHWPYAFLAIVMGFVVWGSVWMMVTPAGEVSIAFWVALLPASTVYVWSAIEAFLLTRVLRKRARLGMVDPLVVNRTFQWGLSGVCVVAMTAVSFVGRLVYGPVIPPWPLALNALLGLLCALAIWLGFFPPAAFRARVARAYGA